MYINTHTKGLLSATLIWTEKADVQDAIFWSLCLCFSNTRDTVRGTLRNTHWCIALTLNLTVHQTVFPSQIIISSTQTFKVDEPQRTNAAFRHFKGICKKSTTQEFKVLLVFITLYSSIGQISKLLKAARQLGYSKQGKEPSNCPLKERLFFLWSFSLSCKVSFLLYI